MRGDPYTSTPLEQKPASIYPEARRKFLVKKFRSRRPYRIRLSILRSKESHSIECRDSLGGLTKQNYVTYHLVYHYRFHHRSDFPRHHAWCTTSRLCCHHATRRWRFNSWGINRPLVPQTPTPSLVSPPRPSPLH